MKKQILAIGGACLMTALAVLPCGPPHEVVIPQTVLEIPQALPAEHDKSQAAIESITRYNPSITDGEAENLWRIVRDTVGRFRADPAYSGGAVEKITPELVLSVILVESSARSRAHSKAGAMGLMQIVPVHHIDSLHSAGILSTKDKNELWNAERNVMAGTYILMCYAMSSESIAEALARYNAGRRIAAGMPYARKVLGLHDRIFGQSHKRSVVNDTGQKSG